MGKKEKFLEKADKKITSSKIGRITKKGNLNPKDTTGITKDDKSTEGKMKDFAKSYAKDLTMRRKAVKLPTQPSAASVLKKTIKNINK
jgi:hypothetical protein